MLEMTPASRVTEKLALSTKPSWSSRGDIYMTIYLTLRLYDKREVMTHTAEPFETHLIVNNENSHLHKIKGEDQFAGSR